MWSNIQKAGWKTKLFFPLAAWFDFSFVVSISISKKRTLCMHRASLNWLGLQTALKHICCQVGHSGIPPQFYNTAAGQQPRVTPPTEWLWALCGRLCLSGHSSLHYKSKWLINGPWTGDTSPTRSVYHPHHRKAPAPLAAASSRSALASILSSPLLTHPFIFYSCGAGVLFKKQARA